MKIAIIGSFGSKIPLKAGKIHAPLLLAYNLAVELAKMGNKVTYFGIYDKDKVVQHPNLKYDDLNYVEVPDELKENISSVDIRLFLNLIYEQGYIAKILSLNEFDVFYSWAAYRVIPVATITNKPVVVTHHDSTNMDAYNSMFFSCSGNNIFTIPISDYMKKQIKYLRQLSVVHNAVNLAKIPFFKKPEDYFCWLGRVVPAKGLDIAIDLSKKLGFKLKFAGPMIGKFGDFGPVEEYNNKIQKEIDIGNVEYLGTLTQDESFELIAKSKGLIFPTDGTESFSMITAESISAGVPVIAFNKGPLPELIDEGKTGFLCNDIRDMEDAIKKIESIDRDECRKIGHRKFDQVVMAKKYYAEFKKAIEIVRDESSDTTYN